MQCMIPGYILLHTRYLRCRGDHHIVSNLGTCTHKVYTYSVEPCVRIRFTHIVDGGKERGQCKYEVVGESIKSSSGGI